MYNDTVQIILAIFTLIFMNLAYAKIVIRDKNCSL